MEEGRRSGEHSGIVVKNRSSSGCLIVKKKGDGAGSSSGSRKVFESKKEKKRSRMVLSESGSSDELLMPPHTRVGPETIRVCNGLTVYDKGIREDSEIDRKRNRAEHLRHNEDDIFGRNGEHSKRNKLDVFEFDEYDGIDGEMMMRRKHFEEGGDNVGRRRLLGAMPVARSGMVREYESGSSRDVIPEKRKDSYIDRSGSLSRGNHGYKNRFEMSRDETRLPISLLREKYMGDSEEPIRLQGKNGVLKVMVNKKKKMSGSPRSFDYLEAKESQSASKVQETVRMNIPVRSAFYSETEVLEKPAHVVRTKKNETSLPKSPPTKNSKGCNQDLEDSDSSLPPEPKDVEEPIKRSSSKGDKTPAVQLAPAGIKEGKVKRGCGTEKQRLRERIRGMLLDAGWTIDYRPRRNRDYLDAVYINPTGTAYWSIIKAYDALQKQLNDEEEEAKPSRDASAFTPISDEVLSQLTRKTRKRIEKEMKKKQRDDSDSEVEKEAPARKSSNTRNEEESMDSGSHEEKLSSFIKQGGKSLKNRTNENGMNSGNSRGQSSLHASIERPSSGSNSRVLHGRKSKKLGRCTLLVRSSNEGKNSETGAFVPYSGKRTLLSWLIDSGTVQLSQKVQYMNRRRTRVMLEGWVTRDGIHCGCCSKILTVSKFEIHAGSKLRQPFQNIYLDSGVSLLQCQMDAWNRQEESKPFGFHSVHIDGDDPNDDTCGICGDGGDLICCDGCPSTFHQSCLDIQMLPPGDWHCPNCTCKFCGIAGGDITQVEDATICALLTCSMCEKKYHNSCIQEMDVLPTDSIGSVPSLCGQKCRELFDHLQKYIGTKHELEAGFSWSLIHRIDSDSELSSRGLPQRVESNSKLAVALAVMDECFLPIADRRSGINLIRNVLYNCGSNFNRLNYSGFYTAILERGDEIISAASIRFHGTQLAEMPFIGTRHIYRRQGMCRRLFGAIESALCSLKVEKLVIPAIAEFMDAWTTVFGFKPLEDSLKKETRSMNMLVFPGIDMLQKRLLEQENFNGDIATTTGAKQMQQKADIPHVASSDVGSLAEHEHQECDNGGLGPTIEGNGEVAGIESDSPRLGVSLDKTTVMSGSLDASEELQIPTSAEGTVCADSQPVKGIAKSNDRRCQFVSETNQNAMEMETEPRVDSPVEDNTESYKEADRGDARVIEVNVVASNKVEIPLSVEGTSSMDSQSGLELAKFSSDGKCLVSSCKVQSILEVANKTALSSRAEDDSQSCKEGMDVDVAADVDLAVDVKVATSLETQVLAEGTICSDFHSTSKLAESAFASDEDIENKSLLDSPVVDNTNTCKQRDMHDAFAIGADVATSYEAQVLTDGTLCSNSQPQEELAESASDKQCCSVSNMSCIALEAETKAVLSSPDEDIALPSKGHTGDGNAVNSNIVGSSEPTTPVSLEVRIDADPQLGDKLVESASVTKCEDDTESGREDHMDDNIACLEPVPSSGCEEGNQSYVVWEAAPEAKHFEESILQSSGW